MIIAKIKKFVDHLLVIFPFEVDFYQNNGIEVTYVGNPLLDEISKGNFKFTYQTEKPIIALLPGSRKQEIEKILSVTFNNAEKIKQSKRKHSDDPSGKSTYTATYFLFDIGGRGSVTCYDMDRSTGFSKNIGVSIQSKTVSDWVDSNYGLDKGI